MRIHARLRASLVVMAAISLVAASCSSSSPTPAAVSLEEYFQRVRALHETQESQSEAITQRFAEELSGDEAGLDALFGALVGVLPEFLPEFAAALRETGNDLAEITPPASV